MYKYLIFLLAVMVSFPSNVNAKIIDVRCETSANLPTFTGSGSTKMTSVFYIRVDLKKKLGWKSFSPTSIGGVKLSTSIPQLPQKKSRMILSKNNDRATFPSTEKSSFDGLDTRGNPEKYSKTYQNNDVIFLGKNPTLHRVRILINSNGKKVREVLSHARIKKCKNIKWK